MSARSEWDLARRLRRRALPAVVATVVSLVAAACGDDGLEPTTLHADEQGWSVSVTDDDEALACAILEPAEDDRDPVEICLGDADRMVVHWAATGPAQGVMFGVIAPTFGRVSATSVGANGMSEPQSALADVRVFWQRVTDVGSAAPEVRVFDVDAPDVGLTLVGPGQTARL